MPRLSIVIPVLGNLSALERTLVSVLGNRPPDCEVLVVLGTDYDDPYDLRDEVRFLAARPGASYAECVNVGLYAAHADVAHILAPGVEVCEGWTEPALEQFANSQVAAVAPVVLDAADHERPIAAGVRYRAWGSREIHCPRNIPTAEAAARTAVLGPCLTAAFYRVAPVLEAGGFDRSVSSDLADADLALALRAAGYRSAVEAASLVFAEALIAPPASGFLRGLYAQRMFWRNAPLVGWLRSLVTHPFYVAGEFLGHAAELSAYTRLAGRFFACCQLGYYRQPRKAHPVERLAPEPAVAGKIEAAPVAAKSVRAKAG